MATATRPIAPITDTSYGIGEALTQCFASADHDLVLVARSADKLKALAKPLETEHEIKVLVLPTISPRRVRRSSARPHSSAAGACLTGWHQAIIDLNISALTAMLSHLLRLVVARGSGTVDCMFASSQLPRNSEQFPAYSPLMPREVMMASMTAASSLTRLLSPSDDVPAATQP